MEYLEKVRSQFLSLRQLTQRRVFSGQSCWQLSPIAVVVLKFEFRTHDRQDLPIILMANVTVSPGRSGPVEVLVQLEDPEENPLAAEGLSVTLSNPDSGIAPITTTAERIASDTWRARMLVSEAGKWSLALRIAMTSKEKVEIAAPILIE